jgi:hypothetical protein
MRIANELAKRGLRVSAAGVGVVPRNVENGRQALLALSL